MQVPALFIAKNKEICDNISIFYTPMNNDPKNDEVRKETDEDGLLDDLADEFTNGDPDEALERMENLGYDIDDLPL